MRSRAEIEEPMCWDADTTAQDYILFTQNRCLEVLLDIRELLIQQASPVKLNISMGGKKFPPPLEASKGAQIDATLDKSARESA